MHFRQFYLGCLAQASYFIGSEGEAAVVDPRRDVDIYIDEAREQGFVIRHVIETHAHADFVSGHRELAARTGARVYFGAQAGDVAGAGYTPVREGDEIRFGTVILRFLETPGHTPESVSVLVFDTETSSSVPYGVLTGDALFIGDVGRPDLLGSRMPAAELAGMLYDSLHDKLLKLPGEVMVFPAHGAGSMCGRNISSENSSTIERERESNYALQPMSREEFIQLMTTDLPEAPAYFSHDAEINREGPALMAEMPELRSLSAQEVRQLRDDGALILDTRPSAQYGNAHIPGSLNIGLGGQFASWAGSLIRFETPVVIVAESEAAAEEARVRLSRVGLDHVSGYLAGGILEWDRAKLPLASVEQISVEELQHRIESGLIDATLDVRKAPEWNSGHIPNATHAPLGHLVDSLGGIPRDARVATVCAGGFRSSIATSILERNGFTRISNVVGGMTAWHNAKLPLAA
ncbi:MAG TPA: rhodanese-like domain-containing protein [Terriglobia bacterium]|nr:rhodanese-like domain-containing protein [Terriglobia bacterium]